jgi:uncharacterized protein (DUF362 family)
VAVECGIGRTKANPFIENGKVLVSKVASGSDVKEAVSRSVELIGGFEKIVEKGDEVLVKPNFNSADPPPASSSPDFLKAVIELLYEHGAGKVVVGESSLQGTSTRTVMEKTGALAAAKAAGAEVVFFDEEKWVNVNVGGKYLGDVSLPKRALKADRLIYCCCMKTHFRADFSLSLKLGFGFVKGSERLAFHLHKLKEKLVDLNLVFHPNLMIMDGRKCFITGGPFSGKVRAPGVVLASGDRVAIDVESIKIIEGYKDSKLKDAPWSYLQICRAAELGLGVRGEDEYKVLTK